MAETTAAAVATAERTTATNWTAGDAIAAFPALSALAEECGYRLSMLGSVLEKGEGRDLDLLLTPFGSLPNREVEFLKRFGGRLMDSRSNAAHNIKGFCVKKDGRLYDFIFGQFWRPRRPGEGKKR